MNELTAPPPADAGTGLPDAEQLLWQANELLDRRRLSEARRVLGQALKDAPGHTGLLLAAARADYLDDDNAGARQLLRQVLVAEPRHVDGRYLMFWVAMDEGQLAEAEDWILGLLRDTPDMAVFYAAYARLMLRSLQLEKAGQLADEALRLAPQDETCLRVRAMCDLVAGRHGRDNRALMQLIVGDPQDVQTLRLLVASLSHAGRPREALRLARELLRADPHDANLLALVKALSFDNHWALKPLWPTQRFGWGGVAATWVLAIAAMRLTAVYAPAYANLVVWAWLGYVAYSWIVPPLLRRWMLR